MWESLATTRRQDRVLHGAAKAVNLGVGLILFPLWLVGQRLAGPFRRLLGLLDPGQDAPLPVPIERERSMDALLRDLKSIPSRIRPSRTAELRKALPELTPFVLAQRRETVDLMYSYPSQFAYQTFEGFEGVQIAAKVALHDAPRPGLLVVHGVFTTHRFDYVREIAVRAYYDWGFNVAAVDLRSFGLTDVISAAPNTAGWKEGEDLVAAGRWLKGLGSTTVGALGISLGASSVLNASYCEGADQALDGGGLSVCGPTDTHRAAERLSRDVSPGHPAYPIRRLFDAALTSRVSDARWPVAARTLVEVVESVSAPYYEVTADEIWRRSSAVNHVQDTKVPLLALHAEDDYVIKVEHAQMLERAAADNDLVRTWIVPGGGHAAFDAIDKRWTYAVYRTFFERWASYTRPDPTEVVYSPTVDGEVRIGG